MTAGDGHQTESLEHIHGILTCRKSVRNTYTHTEHIYIYIYIYHGVRKLQNINSDDSSKLPLVLHLSWHPYIFHERRNQISQLNSTF